MKSVIFIISLLVIFSQIDIHQSGKYYLFTLRQTFHEMNLKSYTYTMLILLVFSHDIDLTESMIKFDARSEDTIDREIPHLV